MVVLTYCPNEGCSEYLEAKCIHLHVPPFVDDSIIEDLLRCEECRGYLARVSDVPSSNNPQYW
jgi:hypothetical protein